MTTNLKNNWRTQDRDIREYTDCIITHLHVTNLLTLHFLIIAVFFLLKSFISHHTILRDPGPLKTNGMTSPCHARRPGIDCDMPSGLQHSWLTTSITSPCIFPPSSYHHQAASFGRESFRRFKRSWCAFLFQKWTLIAHMTLFIILTYFYLLQIVLFQSRRHGSMCASRHL